MQPEELTDSARRLARTAMFGTEPHVVIAKEHLGSDDAHRLRYACLELRFALERIAYYKLGQRIEGLSAEELSAWQPARVLDILMELVDPFLSQDFQLSVGKNRTADPQKDEYLLVGTNKGIDPKKLGRYWHKLGSHLHASVPKSKGERPAEPDAQKLRAFLIEVIGYIDEMTSTAFDMFFSESSTYTCTTCEKPIVRNKRALKEGIVVQCHNPHCNASFAVVTKDGQLGLKERGASFKCDCPKPMFVPANELIKIPHDKSATLACDKCHVSFNLRWVIEHGRIKN